MILWITSKKKSIRKVSSVCLKVQGINNLQKRQSIPIIKTAIKIRLELNVSQCTFTLQIRGKKVLIFLYTEDLSGPSFNQATQMHDTFTLIN